MYFILIPNLQHISCFLQYKPRILPWDYTLSNSQWCISMQFPFNLVNSFPVRIFVHLLEAQLARYKNICPIHSKVWLDFVFQWVRNSGLSQLDLFCPSVNKTQSEVLCNWCGCIAWALRQASLPIERTIMTTIRVSNHLSKWKLVALLLVSVVSIHSPN